MACARSLRAAAVERVVAATGICVRPVDAPGDVDVTVLVDPDTAAWDRARSQGRPVVAVVGSEPDGDALLALVVAGAHGVLTWGCTPDELVAAITAVAAGGTGLTSTQVRVLSGAVQDRSLLAAESVALTERERDILLAIADGLSVKQTAARLGISSKTVESIQSPLFRKLGVRNRSQAVATALERGLVDPR